MPVTYPHRNSWVALRQGFVEFAPRARLAAVLLFLQPSTGQSWQNVTSGGFGGGGDRGGDLGGGGGGGGGGEHALTAPVPASMCREDWAL